MFDRLFHRSGRAETVQNAAPPEEHFGDDGWVELANGHLVVHDPVGNGRFATLVPEGSVLLWVNGEAAADLIVVAASDTIRCEVDANPANFFSLQVTDDRMLVEMTLVSDPFRLPDMLSLTGQNPARLRAGYSNRAKPRPGSPKQLILDSLHALGVQFGIDEEAIDRELVARTGHAVAVARGQEAKPYEPGRWAWRLGELGLVEPGQIIAVHEGGQNAQACITVTGEATEVYTESPGAGGYVPGPGTRLMSGGRLVASAVGRARLAAGSESTVTVVPVRSMSGEVTGELTVAGDLIVRGTVRDAQITATGEVLVFGDMEKSEVRAEQIFIQGTAHRCTLLTVPAGDFVPFRAEIGFVQRRVQELQDAVINNRQNRDHSFRQLGLFTRAVRRKVEEAGVTDPGFMKLVSDLADTFSKVEGLAEVNLHTLSLLQAGMTEVLAAGEERAAFGDVQAATLTHCTVWAGHAIRVQEKLANSALYCGESVQMPAEAMATQSQIVSGGEVRLGVMATLRGSSPVTVRARRLEAVEMQMGCVFEFGAEQKEIKTDLLRVTVGVNPGGAIGITQK